MLDDGALTRVLHAAEQLFGGRPYLQVTLDEVADAAVVEIDTLKSEFADTAELCLRVVQVRAHEMRVHLHMAVQGLSSRSMMEGAGYQAYFDWICEHPNILKVLRQSEIIDPVVYRHWYADLASDYVRGLRQSMDEGEIMSVDPEALAYCLMGMGDMLGQRYVQWEQRPSLPPEVLKTFQRVLNRALSGR